MKRTLILAIAISLTFLACKKNPDTSQDDVALARKYAKFNAAVYKDSDLKKWLATLSKAEYVDLLDVTKNGTEKKEMEIAKVRLTDDSVGYTDMKNLAEKPVVFVTDTKAYVRNNLSSTVYATIPRGTIAFITDEKGEWIQIYAGKINDRWISDKWVNSGFSAEERLILEARNYEDASRILDDKSDKITSAQKEQATEQLKDIAGASTMFGDMARAKLQGLGIQSAGPADDYKAGEPSEDINTENRNKEPGMSD